MAAQLIVWGKFLKNKQNFSKFLNHYTQLQLTRSIGSINHFDYIVNNDAKLTSTNRPLRVSVLT